MPKSMNTLKSTTIVFGVLGALSACGTQSVEGQSNSVPEISRTTEIPTPTSTETEPQTSLIPTSFPREEKVCTRFPELDDSRRGARGITILRFAEGTTCEMAVHDSADPSSPEIGKMGKDTLFTINCYKALGDVMVHNSALQVRYNTLDTTGNEISRYDWVFDNDDAWIIYRPEDENISDCEQVPWDPNGPQPPLVVMGHK